MGHFLIGPTVPLGETVEVGQGLSCAILEYGAKNIWLKGDLLCAVNWIKAHKGCGTYTEMLIQDMRVWIDSIDNCWCSHITCEDNITADYMAGVGSRGNAL